MMYTRSTGLFAIVALAAATPAHAAVLFGDGFGNGVTYSFVQSAFAVATGSTTKSDSKNDQKTLTTLPVAPVVSSLIASISDTFGANTYSATASGTMTTTFNGAGAASLRSVGSATATGVGSGDAYAQGAFGLSYYFRTTTSESFSISYLLSSSTLSCCGNQISLLNTSAGTSVLQRTIYNADNKGTLTANLAAGNYRLQISKGEGYGFDAPHVSGSNGGTSTIGHDDLFTFQIGAPATPAVPEPATWAMMIGGFGLIGGTLRRRGTVRQLANA